MIVAGPFVADIFRAGIPLPFDRQHFRSQRHCQPDGAVNTAGIHHQDLICHPLQGFNAAFDMILFIAGNNHSGNFGHAGLAPI